MHNPILMPVAAPWIVDTMLESAPPVRMLELPPPRTVELLLEPTLQQRSAARRRWNEVRTTQWGPAERLFADRVQQIEDRELRKAVAFLLSAAHDHDPLVRAVLDDPPDSQHVNLHAVEAIDGDVDRALLQRFGRTVLGEACTWLKRAVAGQCPAFACWIFRRTTRRPEQRRQLDFFVGESGIAWDPDAPRRNQDRREPVAVLIDERRLVKLSRF